MVLSLLRRPRERSPSSLFASTRRIVVVAERLLICCRYWWLVLLCCRSVLPSLVAGSVSVLFVARCWLVGTVCCRSIRVARQWSVVGVDCCVLPLMSSSVRRSSVSSSVAASTVLVDRCSVAGVGRRVLLLLDRVLSGGPCRVVSVVDCRVSPVGFCRWRCSSSAGPCLAARLGPGSSVCFSSAATGGVVRRFDPLPVPPFRPPFLSTVGTARPGFPFVSAIW